jgi:hypothetical protein
MAAVRIEPNRFQKYKKINKKYVSKMKTCPLNTDAEPDLET